VNGFGCTVGAGAPPNACQGFAATNLDCQRDVLLHEFNHSIGIAHERQDRAAVKTPADAFNNADTMASFVTQLTGSPTDRCGDP